MSISRSLLKRHADAITTAANHPFNGELASGSLSKEKFINYLQQDSVYLGEYAKTFALLAARTQNIKHCELLLDFAKGALIEEKLLHAKYFAKFDVPPIDNSFTMTAACLSYTSFLLAKASVAPLVVAMTATLPCFIVYQQAGQSLSEKVKGDNPYRAWVDAYSADEFAVLCEQALDLVDELAEGASTETLKAMDTCFKQGCAFEYNFWNDVYAPK